MNERLEYQIAMVSVALRDIDFAKAVGELNAGVNSPSVRIPMAYAMFRLLVEDVADDPASWGDFLRDALNETGMRYA